jgi:hypothetical protein
VTDTPLAQAADALEIGTFVDSSAQQLFEQPGKLRALGSEGRATRRVCPDQPGAARPRRNVSRCRFLLFEQQVRWSPTPRGRVREAPGHELRGTGSRAHVPSLERDAPQGYGQRSTGLRAAEYSVTWGFFSRSSSGEQACHLNRPGPAIRTDGLGCGVAGLSGLNSAVALYWSGTA